MRGRLNVFELQRVLIAPKPPLGDQGEVGERSEPGRDEKVYVLTHLRRRALCKPVTF